MRTSHHLWSHLPRKRLSLSRNRFTCVTENEVLEAQKGYVPDNTSRSTKWAVSNFQLWLDSANEAAKDKDKYPGDISLTDDPELLCSCLCKYVLETRKETGENYPPTTLMNLLPGLLSHMRACKRQAFNTMDEKDPIFTQLHKVMDSFFRKLHRGGIGTRPNRSEIISLEEEDVFWSIGVLGIDSPRKLLNAVFTTVV